MTLNKVRGAATREARLRRDYRRDQTATAANSDPGEDEGWWIEQAGEGEPTPDDAAALAVEAEERLTQLPADLRCIAQYKLEGYTNAEIAALPDMGCTERTVERKLKLIREAWGEPS